MRAFTKHICLFVLTITTSISSAWGQTPTGSKATTSNSASPPEAASDTTQASVPADAASSEASSEPSNTTTAAAYEDTISVAPPSNPEPELTVKAPSNSRLIEEIIVTAQKREENLQDVPISVQAFSAARLDALGVTNQAGLAQITPSLEIGTQVGYTTIFLRGVGSDAFLTADPSVASYVDGIYFPFAYGLVQDFGAVERIEVLKGPQGTLFGRNTTGGAISVITRSPSFDAAEVSVQTEYARYNDLHSRAYVNIPLTDTLATSVSAIYNEADSYYSGTIDGRGLPKENSHGARFKLRWAPTDELDFNLSALELKADGSNTFFVPNQRPTLLGQLLLIQPHTGYEGALDAPVYYSISNKVVYGQGTYSGSAFDVKLLGSYQDIQTSGLYDFDQSNLPYVVFNNAGQYSKPKSAELQLLSNKGSWGSDWLQVTSGLYYFKSRQGFSDVRLQVADLDLQNGTLAGIQLPTNIVTSLLPLQDYLASGQVYLVGLVDTESTAAYLQTTFTFNDYVALILGARYQIEKRSIAKSTVGLTEDSVLIDNTHKARDQDGNAVSAENTTRSFKPKISLDLHPFGDDTLLYASYQRALKAGTYNVIAIYTQPAYVRPEETSAYEMGLKSRLFDGLMTFNTAAFWYEIKDLQQQYVSLLNGGAVSFENAGRARIRGVDFDTTIQLVPNLVDGLVLVGGGAFVDATYTDYIGSGFNEAGIFTQGNNYTGNDVVRAPRFSASLTLSKTWDVTNGSVEIAGDTYYNGGYYYAASNFDSTRQDSYSVFGARVSYLYDPWKLRLTLFGKNLGNDVYSNGALFTDFGQSFSLASPRTYGLRLNWDF